MKRLKILLKAISTTYLHRMLFLAIILALVSAVAFPATALAAKKIPTLAEDHQYIFNAWYQNGRIYIYVANLQADHRVTVKMFHYIKGRGQYDIEKLTLLKGSTVLRGYTIPDKLATKVFIKVCLKERATGELVCRFVYNPDFKIEY